MTAVYSAVDADATVESAAISAMSDEELRWPCPYPAGSAAKIHLMAVRNDRFAGTDRTKVARLPAIDDNASTIMQDDDNPAAINPGTKKTYENHTVSDVRFRLHVDPHSASRRYHRPE